MAMSTIAGSTQDSQGWPHALCRPLARFIRMKRTVTRQVRWSCAVRTKLVLVEGTSVENMPRKDLVTQATNLVASQARYCENIAIMAPMLVWWVAVLVQLGDVQEEEFLGDQVAPAGARAGVDGPGDRVQRVALVEGPQDVLLDSALGGVAAQQVGQEGETVVAAHKHPEEMRHAREVRAVGRVPAVGIGVEEMVQPGVAHKKAGGVGGILVENVVARFARVEEFPDLRQEGAVHVVVYGAQQQERGGDSHKVAVGWLGEGFVPGVQVQQRKDGVVLAVLRVDALEVHNDSARMSLMSWARWLRRFLTSRWWKWSRLVCMHAKAFCREPRLGPHSEDWGRGRCCAGGRTGGGVAGACG